MGKYKKLYKMDEVLEIFDITAPTLRVWCKKNILCPIKKPGMRKRYITAESIERLLRGE